MVITSLQFLLPKLLNISLLISSLIISSPCESDQLFVFFGLLMGCLMDISFFTTFATIDAINIKKTEIALTILITAFTAMIGFDILINKRRRRRRRRENMYVVVMRRMVLCLLPVTILVNQGMETLVCLAKLNKNIIMQQLQPIEMILLVTVSAAIGFAYYYINMIYISVELQKCCNSFIIYFTGAIALSKLFQIVHQFTPTSLVVLIRNQILTSQQSYHDEITGGYNLYWLLISCYLLYDIKSR